MVKVRFGPLEVWNRFLCSFTVHYKNRFLSEVQVVAEIGPFEDQVDKIHRSHKVSAVIGPRSKIWEDLEATIGPIVVAFKASPTLV